MKQLYLECNMGASGDMLMGALYDICPVREAFLGAMEALSIPGVHIHADTVQKSGIGGISVTVHIHGQEETSCDVPLGHAPHSHDDHEAHDHHHHEHDHTHEDGHHHEHDHTHDHEHTHVHDHGHTHTHNSMTDIRAFIEKAPVSNRVREDALGVYLLIAEAEAAVHGTTPEQVHFHEVGSLDALADILGCCILMEMIAPDHVVCSPVHVGSGQVQCAHGILPVPAPATARILAGVPIYSGDIRGELCTPTGAALLRYFADEFGPMPAMVLEKTGYGFGKKEFAVVNCLRAMLGHRGGSAKEIIEIRCNIDDMTGEALGVALEILMDNGALDAFFTPIQMKKNRPAVMLTCLCKPDEREKFAQLILVHTTTLGVRISPCSRIVMDWQVMEKQTPYGKIRFKKSEGYGIQKIKPEFTDVKAAAARHGVSFDTVYAAVMRDA